MTTRLILWSTALALAGTVMAVAAGGQAQGDFSEERHEERLPGKAAFFRDSGLGAVAMMPNVTSRNNAPFEREYYTLGGSGRYGLDLDEEGWFIVNHRSSFARGHTYVGVLVAKRFGGSLGRELELYRNDGWHGAPNVFQRIPVGKGWGDFLALQDSTQNNFEDEFGDWHAVFAPQASESSQASDDASSWYYRNWLDESIRARVDECFRAIDGQPSSDVFYEVRLLRFQFTEGLNSRYPVVWDVGLRNVGAFYMRTFSPAGIDFDGEYCIEIE